MVLPSLSAVTFGATGLVTSLTERLVPRSALTSALVLVSTSSALPALDCWRTTLPSTSLMLASVGVIASLGARAFTNRSTRALSSE
jgi:hypothetical protein